ncbi:MAG: LysM peptidoglycan-binding domain-containing protein [Acidimicrobiales bacterium]|nr:LysM peptidoglycan-binding domain-containing protein [Acidimicrobiales bacterium]
MNDRRPLLLIRGVLSLVATLALIVGVPLLLATLVGWPLPTSIPTLHALEEAAQSGISDQVVVNTLAVIAWIAWPQLALALVTEAVGVARGRQAIHLPVLPAFQVTATRLVAGILMMASTVQPARAVAEPTPIPVPAEVAAATPESIPDSPDPSSYGHTPTLHGRPSDPAPAAPAADHPTVTVQRHDSYWAIAERTLGDGLRWNEILDLNVGRTLPDGTTISAGDDTLHSGWVLVLPGDATIEPAASPSGGPAPATAEEDGLATLVVERGDNFWSIAEDRLEGDLGREVGDPEVLPYWGEVVAANRARYAELVDVDLIYPGQVVVLPPTGVELPPPPPTAEEEPAPSPAGAVVLDEPPTATTEPAPATENPASEETPPTTTAADNDGVPRQTVDESSQGDPSEGEDSSDAPVAVALGGLSSIALAVGLKRLLDRRRRRFVNENPGDLPGRTPADQRELHQTVIAQADEGRIDDLQGVLGRLAASLAAMGSERRPRMIRHSDTSLEVLLDQPDPNALPGWHSTDDGTVWTLVERPDNDEPYDGPLSPSPLMVTVGQPEDDAQLYLDLEADGIVALTGDLDVATNLARSIVTELTLSPLADTLRVIAIGDFVDPGADVLEHLTIVDTWDGHAEDLVAWSTQSHAALAENGWANAFVGRGHDPDHDALVPIAVVADRPPPDELAAALRAAQPSAVAVVVVGEFRDALATVCCEEDALNFDAINLACSPQELEADELAATSSLLVATDSPAEQELMDQLRAEFEASASSNGTGPTDGDEPDLMVEGPGDPADEPPEYDVLVRLLGDITVEGGEPLKPKATAVVAYLALHRSVTTDRLEEACWFGSDGVSHTKRLHDTMAECRSALGSQHFPANRSGKYVVGPHVGTDLDLFDWHVQRAAELPPDEAVEHYQAALDLVTGKPFSYPNAARASYGWVDFEHHSTSWEHRVAGVAQACAAMHLDAGEPDKAIAMLRRVIQAIPLNSAVVETLMRAHIADEDRAGAENVYREHVAALEQAKLGDPEDSIEQLRLELHPR